MTRKQIAEALDIHINRVHEAFELCGKYHPEIKEKSSTYKNNCACDFTLDEVLLAMSYYHSGNGLTNIEVCLIKENFTMNKKVNKAEYIKGTEEFLRKVRNFPKSRCCSTCIYCTKSYMRNKKPVYRPFCKFWERFLNMMGVNPYKDWCKQWEFSKNEPLVFTTDTSISNIDINGNVRNEVLGFDVSNFHSKTEKEIKLVTDIGLSSASTPFL